MDEGSLSRSDIVKADMETKIDMTENKDAVKMIIKDQEHSCGKESPTMKKKKQVKTKASLSSNIIRFIHEIWSIVAFLLIIFITFSIPDRNPSLDVQTKMAAAICMSTLQLILFAMAWKWRKNIMLSAIIILAMWIMCYYYMVFMKFITYSKTDSTISANSINSKYVDNSSITNFSNFNNSINFNINNTNSTISNAYSTTNDTSFTINNINPTTQKNPYRHRETNDSNMNYNNSQTNDAMDNMSTKTTMVTNNTYSDTMKKNSSNPITYVKPTIDNTATNISVNLPSNTTITRLIKPGIKLY